MPAFPARRPIEVKVRESPPFWLPGIHAARRPYLVGRGRIAAALRAWFAARDFIEVETAALQVSPGPIRSVAKACRWVSLPGEICRAAVSTSMKSWPANQALSAAAMRPRPKRCGRRAAWMPGSQNGGLLGTFTSTAGPAGKTGVAREDRYGAARNRAIPRPPPTQGLLS